MTITAPEVPASGSKTTATARAVTYLRVSTKEQAEKGGQDEGYSIPAQRAANYKKAEQIDAVIVQEFVDAGESARKADRPALLRMLAYVKDHQVSYCIVHKVDRLARNRADDVSIHLALQEAGVTLVSASENIDETPSGMLLHGIMSTIAEFYSRNLATESIKGMTQKALSGGTPTKAPIGYLNVGVRDEQGREVRTVEVDPERGPLIAWAFKAYATGDWTESQLRRELTSRGLATVPTPKRPSKPVSKTQVHRILTNPYYKGSVVFKDATYRGVHDPLVPPEVFHQAQLVLQAHSTAADRTHVHDHYLKGTVFCGGCGSRLIITKAKNSKGRVYPYFVCAGRHEKRTDCKLQAIPIDTVERLVEDHYANLVIPADRRGALRGAINARYDQATASARPELEARLGQAAKIRTEQDRLLDAHLAGAVTLDMLKRKQGELQDRLEAVEDHVKVLSEDYAANRRFVDDSLALVADCQALYLRSNASTRRIANQVFFKRIYVDEHVTGRPPKPCREVRVVFEFPYDKFYDPEIVHEAEEWAVANETAAQQAKADRGSAVACLSLTRLGWLTGLEPAATWTTTRCSTN